MLDSGTVQSLLSGTHGAPRGVLGPHHWKKGKSPMTTVRVLHPGAQRVRIKTPKTDMPMTAVVDAPGLFEVDVPGHVTDYRLHFEGYHGQSWSAADPYAFAGLLSEFDLHLLSEGEHLHAYDKLGAHPRTVDGVEGVHFAIWAPNARQVSVVGDFNAWDARVHGMMRSGGSGIWELFIPGLTVGDVYKFSLLTPDGRRLDKADPYGFQAEVRPKTANVVADLDGFEWGDEAWMSHRAAVDPLREPISILEVHLGSWARVPETNGFLTYDDLARSLVAYVQAHGYTHIELMPVSEHPYDPSWGYQVVGYYAPTSRFGSPKDFMRFVDTLHQANIGVLLDWVPAHFPRDPHGLAQFDGTALYEHADPRQGTHPDWGTNVFNFGRHEVRNFLLSNALYWLKLFHIDGLRVDAVSSMLYLDYSRQPGEWVPNAYGGRENLEAISFLQRMNTLVHEHAPGAITVAEESTSWPMVSRPVYLGGLGFTFKWNMGWMNDTLAYFKRDPIHRTYHHSQLTFSLLYAFNENFILALSHDEVVHLKGSLLEKMPGDLWQKFANVRALFGYLWTHPGKKLIFQGMDFGQWAEWNESQSLDWHLAEYEPHQRLQRWVADLNAIYRTHRQLWSQDYGWDGFNWINPNDADQSVLSYLRTDPASPDEPMVVVLNLTPVVRHDYRVPVPVAGFYEEVLNSDAAIYGGSNVGNSGGVHSWNDPWNPAHQALSLTLPPLSVLVLRRT